jgi:hypothetical protein
MKKSCFILCSGPGLPSSLQKRNINNQKHIDQNIKEPGALIYNTMEFYKIKSNFKLLIYKIKSSISPKSKQTDIRE